MWSHHLWSKHIQKYMNNVVPNDRQTSANRIRQPTPPAQTPQFPAFGPGQVFSPFGLPMATNIPPRGFRPPFHALSRGGGVSNRPPLTRPQQQHQTLQSARSVYSQQETGLEQQPCSSRDNSDSRTSEMHPEGGIQDLKAQFKSAQDVGRYFSQLYYNQRRCKKREGSLEFSIVSYNILASSLAAAHLELYSHNSRAVLDWSYRKRNLLKELRHMSADIVCLQEVDACEYDSWFLPEMKKSGYLGSYMKRTGNKTDGCAIFYKNKTFELVCEHPVSFNKPRVAHMDRDNVAIVLLLKPRQLSKSGSFVCVANTHLLFNKKRGEIKLVQLGYLLAEIDKISFKSGSHGSAARNHPVLLCGDFNTLPHSPLYKFVTKGHIHYGGMCRTMISGQLRGEHHRSGSYTKLTSTLFAEALGVSSQCRFVEQDEEESRVDKSSLDCGLDVLDLLQSEEGATGASQLPSTSAERQAPSRDRQGPLGQSPGEGPQQHSNNPKLELTHDFHFRSAYRHSLPDGSDEVTTKHDCTSCTVDYIFFSSPPGQHGTQEGRLTLQKTLALLSDKDLEKLKGLPNIKLSSDHLALQAFFSLS